MAAGPVSSQTDSLLEILLRAFDHAAPFAPQTAAVILQARLAPADLDRVDRLRKKKRDVGLTPEENARLREYLRAHLFLTSLKSKARQSLRQR